MLKFLSMLLTFVVEAIGAWRYLRAENLGRQKSAVENMAVINERAAHAENIYSDGDIDDGMLLSPTKRSAGGVQGLQADICSQCGRGEGLTETVGGAENKSAQQGLGRKLPEFKKPKRWVKKVYIHCSASDIPEHDNVKVVERWHRQKGWSGIGYHFYIDKAGQVHAGRDLEKIPAAQRNFNTGTIAICCGGEKVFTAAQMASLKSFCAEINRAYAGGLTFHGHCEVSAKSCPNFAYREVLGLDEKGRMKV